MKLSLTFFFQINYCRAVASFIRREKLPSGNFSDLFESEGEMESMESRNEVLRIGFRILHRENIILRRRLREAETENRRLNHLMFTFNF